jgi:tetratricopeptide (TPR) repeat protein
MSDGPVFDLYSIACLLIIGGAIFMTFSMNSHIEQSKGEQPIPEVLPTDTPSPYITVISPSGQKFVTYRNDEERQKGEISRKARTFVDRGMNKLYAEDYKEALKDFDESLQINPSEEAWMGKGRTLNQLGRYEETVEAFNQATKIYPKSDDAWMGKGLALNQLGRYEGAIIAFNEINIFNPWNCDAWNEKGLALNQLGRYEDAIESFDHALKNHHVDEDGRNFALSKINK